MLPLCFLHTLVTTVKWIEIVSFPVYHLIRLSAPWGQGPYFLTFVTPVASIYEVQLNVGLNEQML